MTLDIAVIGMSCIFPQAADLEKYWRNILTSVDTISEPLPNWNADYYLKSNRINTAKGGYIKDLYCFDPFEFGIMPNSLDGGEPDQLLALKVAREALIDAGYFSEACDHQNTGIILGHSTYLHRGQANLIQHHVVIDQQIEIIKSIVKDIDSDQLAAIKDLLKKKLPPANAEIAPSWVPNVMTGRIANRLNFKGPNYLVDAACSSSLLAINAAINELEHGNSDLMLAGGVNASLPAEVSVIFTQLGALSKTGKVRPFDVNSNGTLLGEGVGIVVLKRAADAMADGDRIYAIIKGFGQSSDGRGQGLLAPSLEGEKLAIQRAYESSTIDTNTIQLVEAHGTGIPLGDKTEIDALTAIFGGRRKQLGDIALGSVKSMISHCIPAAGVAGFIKIAKALYHKILPPTLCEKVNPSLNLKATPFYINTELRPWFTNGSEIRRAGINSFGFGGVNTHMILEELPNNIKIYDTIWNYELCVFVAESRQQLIAEMELVECYLKQNSHHTNLLDIAYSLHENAKHKEGDFRIAFIASSICDLLNKVNLAKQRLISKEILDKWSMKTGVNFSSDPIEGKIAFLFPGEGSQYQYMLKDIILKFQQVQIWFDMWSGLYADEHEVSRTDLFFPPKSEIEEESIKTKLEKCLNQMDIGSEAVFIANQSLYHLLKSFGIKPDVLLGHSSGEFSALVASGSLRYNDLSEIANLITLLNRTYKKIQQKDAITTGKLLAVGAVTIAQIQDTLASKMNEVHIAMENCNNQIVLFGNNQVINEVNGLLTNIGAICFELPFNRAYHTSLFKNVSDEFYHYYRQVKLSKPSIPVYSCASTSIFPQDQEAVCLLAASQWSKTVRFKTTIENMYKDGVRFFLEVGPSGNLSSFVNDILGKDQRFVSNAVNLRHKDDLSQLLQTFSVLFVNQRLVNLDKIFENRNTKLVNFKIGPQQKKNNEFFIDNTIPRITLDKQDLEKLQQIFSKNNQRSVLDLSSPITNMITNLDLKNDVTRMLKALKKSLDGLEYQDTSKKLDIVDDQTTFKIDRIETNRLLEVGDLPVEFNSKYPFITKTVVFEERHLTAECYLNLYEDRFLQHHILSGVVAKSHSDLMGLSCVPLMVSLEIMAEACSLHANNRKLRVIENIKAYDWIALDWGEVNLTVKVKLLANQVYEASIYNNSDKLVSANYKYFQDYSCKPIQLEGLPERYFLDNLDLYNTGMFHGEIFQSIKSINAWYGSGIEATLGNISTENFFIPGEVVDFIINPIILDAACQLSAFWIAHKIGFYFNSFPIAISRIELYNNIEHQNKPLKLRGNINTVGEKISKDFSETWDFNCVDLYNKPIFSINHLSNNFFSVPKQFYNCRLDPLSAWLGYPIDHLDCENILIWKINKIPDYFCRQSKAIFLRILAHIFLNFEEREAWYNSGENHEKRLAWLFGRICLKEAIRFWIHQKTGNLLYPSEINIMHDALGAPYIDHLSEFALDEFPSISLSYAPDYVISAVSSNENNIGIDTEIFGRVDIDLLVESALNNSEQSLLRKTAQKYREEITIKIWCAKEAAAKYFGLGLQGAPEKFNVHFPDSDCNDAIVYFKHEFVHVKLRTNKESVIAIAS